MLLSNVFAKSDTKNKKGLVLHTVNFWIESNKVNMRHRKMCHLFIFKITFNYSFNIKAKLKKQNNGLVFPICLQKQSAVSHLFLSLYHVWLSSFIGQCP